MNRRVVILIIVGISLALVGLTIIQVGWIQQAVSLREKRFNQNVYQAMNTTAAKVEEFDAYQFLQSDPLKEYREYMENLSATLPGTSTTIEQQFEIVDDNGRLVVNIGPTDTNIVIEAGSQGSMWVTDSSENLHYLQFDTTMDGGGLMTTNNVTKNQLKEQLAYYNKMAAQMTEQMTLELLFANRSPEDRVHIDETESILTAELSRNGVNTPFQFAIISGDQKDIFYSNIENLKAKKSEEKYTMPLYLDNFFQSQAALVVTFPHKTNFILGSMWLMLTASGLFILLIMLCFGASIYIIFRQKKLSDLKTDFINNMTHELKTPVSTISLASEMLQNDAVIADGKRVKNYSNIIQEENTRLSSHIEKVLQFSRIDKGELKLKREAINFNDLVESVLNNVSIRVESENGELSKELQAEPDKVLCDPVHMTNVVYNLLDNAIKYRNGGQLHIDVKTKTTGKGVTLSVKDNGIGMSQDAQKRIFDKFYRVPTGNLHDVKGFGLGLSYVKAMVEAHNGQISVNSELNKGSEFKVFIPYPNSNN